VASDEEGAEIELRGAGAGDPTSQSRRGRGMLYTDCPGQGLTFHIQTRELPPEGQPCGWCRFLARCPWSPPLLSTEALQAIRHGILDHVAGNSEIAVLAVLANLRRPAQDLICCIVPHFCRVACGLRSCLQGIRGSQGVAVSGRAREPAWGEKQTCLGGRARCSGEQASGWKRGVLVVDDRVI
jgi:hypothetical protein